MDPGFQNIPNTQVDIYLQNAAAHKPGISRDEVNEYYNKWSNKYEQDLNENVYRGPKIAADLCEIFLSEKTSKILDIGSGTGLVGLHLVHRGFEYIDGLEPCESMVTIARFKNVYNKFFIEPIRVNEPTSLKKNSYDACVTSGSFGEGHIPAEGIRELIRVVKPGGFIINVMRKEYLDYVKDYAGRLEPLMDKLEREENLWSLVTKFDVDNYSFNKSGQIFVFKKN